MRVDLIRWGNKYRTEDTTLITSYKGEAIGEVSLTPAVLIHKEIENGKSLPCKKIRALEIKDILNVFRKAGVIFSENTLSINSLQQTPEDYAYFHSLSTGLPISVGIKMLSRTKQIFCDMTRILETQTPGDLDIYDSNYYFNKNKSIGWIPVGNILGVVAPSNHPAVNLLWTIAYAMKYPVIIRPSMDDIFTPYRLIWSLIEAGLPPESLSFLPCDKRIVKELVLNCDYSIIFGSSEIEKQFSKINHIKVYGPGHSKIIVGEDCMNDIETIVDIAIRSMMHDGGRGCINVSSLILPPKANLTTIAHQIAEKLINIEIKDPINRDAVIPAFKDKKVALSINNYIEESLDKETVDITSLYRKSSRIVEAFNTTFLLPTVIQLPSYKHNLFAQEFPFPFLTITSSESTDITESASNSLVVTAITEDEKLIKNLLINPTIKKVYAGNYLTSEIDFAEPHDGFLSEFLYQTKAFRL